MVIMDTRHRRNYQKTPDRGDVKKSLLQKLFHDLDIADFMPNRDRGDSKINTMRQTRILINNNDKPKPNKNRSIEITVSEVKPKKIDELIIRDDDETEYNKEKVLEDTKVQTITKTSSNKLRTSVNRHLVESEKIKPEAYRTEDKTKDRMRNVDKKNRRTDQSCRRTDDISKIGDNKRYKNSERHETFRRMEIIPRLDHVTGGEYCGTEDIREKKLKIVDKNARINNKVNNPRLPPKEHKISDKNIGPAQTYEARKLLRQKYTVKLKNSNKNVDSKDDIGKGNSKNDQSESNSPLEEPKDNLKEPDIYQLIRSKKAKEAESQRKPIIKTIRLAHNNRVYKAVTFVEEKAPLPSLQIKMPNQKKTEETNTMKNNFVKVTLSKVSVNDKRNGKVIEIRDRKYKEKKPRKEKVRNRPSSPVFPTVQGCPQTEVAKWAPSSISQLTKPYYDAWVDTTLTAITKCSEQEKEFLWNKQNIIKTFKRAIDMDTRPDSPDLVYEKMNDEKFMGRITVRQKR